MTLPQPRISIERPRCPRCTDRMMLARVSPMPGKQERRLFECAKCGFSQTVIAPDPIKSDALGWLSGELRRPQ